MNISAPPFQVDGTTLQLVDGVASIMAWEPFDGTAWTDETANRSFGTIYQNTSSKPRMVCINAERSSSAQCTVEAKVEGVTPPTAVGPKSDLLSDGGAPGGGAVVLVFIVLPGEYYRADITAGGVTRTRWAERGA